MRGVFALALIFLALSWICVLIVPCAASWGCFDRVGYYTIFAFGVLLALGVVAIAQYGGFTPSVLPLALDPLDHIQVFFCGEMIVVLVMLIMFGFQLFLVSETTPGFSTFIQSPCGSCSCSAQENNVSVVYNANGVFMSPEGGNLVDYYSYLHTMCVWEPSECHWAPSNGLTVQGYYPIDPPNNLLPDLARPCYGAGCIATNQVEDYPNWGIGLVRGLLLGLGSRSDLVAPCPGVTVVDGLSVGLAPCPACLGVWLQEFPNLDLSAFDHCPRSLSFPQPVDLHWMCSGGGPCPGPNEVRTPKVARALARALLLCALLPVQNFLGVQAVGYPRVSHLVFSAAVTVALVFIPR